MPAIFIVLILVIFVIIFIFFEVMVRIGTAGVSPSKIISELFKKKSDKTDDLLTETPVSLSDEATTDDTPKKIISPACTRSIMRWRAAGGILFSLTLILTLGIISVGRSVNARPLIETYPWLKYPLMALVFLTIFVFYVMWKKERTSKENKSSCVKTKINKDFAVFSRIIFGILSFIFLILTMIIIGAFGLQDWRLIIISGGFCVVFAWVSILGKKPF